MHSAVRSFRTPDGVPLGVEHFGDAAAPLLLLAGGTTMLSWPDPLCAALARGGRHGAHPRRDATGRTWPSRRRPARSRRGDDGPTVRAPDA
jgi:hypothetical protein